MPPSHRRSDSTEQLLTLGEPSLEDGATSQIEDSPRIEAVQEDAEILDILVKANDPPILLSLTPRPESQIGGTKSVEAVQQAETRNVAEVGKVDPISRNSFDKRFPMLLCCTCLCCLVFVLIIVGATGASSSF